MTFWSFLNPTILILEFLNKELETKEFSVAISLKKVGSDVAVMYKYFVKFHPSPYF